MDRKEYAKQLFYEGYACSQAIVMAFSDLVDVDQEQLKKLSLPFGGGIGRLRLTCGAFSGMIMVASLLFSNYEDVEENKIKTYEIVQELAKRFEEVHTTLSCEKILELAQIDIQIGGSPEARTDEYYKKRPCAELCEIAAKLVAQKISEQ